MRYPDYNLILLIDIHATLSISHIYKKKITNRLYRIRISEWFKIYSTLFQRYISQLIWKLSFVFGRWWTREVNIFPSCTVVITPQKNPTARIVSSLHFFIRYAIRLNALFPDSDSTFLCRYIFIYICFVSFFWPLYLSRTIFYCVHMFICIYKFLYIKKSE